MKLTRYAHGTAFEHTVTITMRGEVVGNPVGWGSTSHEQKWLASELRTAFRDAIARFYQCQLHGVSLDITFPVDATFDATFNPPKSSLGLQSPPVDSGRNP